MCLWVLHIGKGVGWGRTDVWAKNRLNGEWFYVPHGMGGQLWVLYSAALELVPV